MISPPDNLARANHRRAIELKRRSPAAARAYQEGFAAGLSWMLREFGPYMQQRHFAQASGQLDRHRAIHGLEATP